ncbi:hypothetical protein EYR41_008162 [Orbilia oligospora]|uniref:Uncharacterized protein n=1 Tax=Orbilia oligospora TaxID=2813651 RepID=A0A7C8NRG8_ORBOL|nr:hypothetical protein TWF751_005360 [Orbilia oligospora]TGJ66539.1 hypothetical protein EYR41_008162 [Orbilia oligospora]
MISKWQSTVCRHAREAKKKTWTESDQRDGNYKSKYSTFYHREKFSYVSKLKHRSHSGRSTATIPTYDYVVCSDCQI